PTGCNCLEDGGREWKTSCACWPWLRSSRGFTARRAARGEVFGAESSGARSGSRVQTFRSGHRVGSLNGAFFGFCRLVLFARERLAERPETVDCRSPGRLLD